MSHHEIPELDTKGLRQFGLMLSGVLALIPGILLPWIKGWEMMPNYYWIGAGLLVAVWALIAADSIGGLYRGWMRVAMLIGNSINRIILAIVFYLVIFPMGVIMRSMGKDPMRRAFEPDATTYRVASKIAPKNHVERPF
ncbi:MAG: hypothetical protein COY36_02480 [Zetaproteobacteria bacterium CG_4_10_14_0_2_um_filter_55_20]|nr:MAG: hypothetical protein COZ01_11000 [Zetaproteobacteria bacterium CG_4_10_14_0_8_um_filter_55_43]PIZ39620.1 MAG: hypothetical protein COY36_02480 [Zetaproteobacteria bacterium CG_4_10_14_0_2_um_filter_55_20]